MGKQRASCKQPGFHRGSDSIVDMRILYTIPYRRQQLDYSNNRERADNLGQPPDEFPKIFVQGAIPESLVST